MLRKKTVENEILYEAVEIARQKLILRAPLLPADDSV
jgi:hypothetical protein